MQKLTLEVPSEEMVEGARIVFGVSTDREATWCLVREPEQEELDRAKRSPWFGELCPEEASPAEEAEILRMLALRARQTEARFAGRAAKLA